EGEPVEAGLGALCSARCNGTSAERRQTPTVSTLGRGGVITTVATEPANAAREGGLRHGNAGDGDTELQELAAIDPSLHEPTLATTRSGTSRLSPVLSPTSRSSPPHL